MKRKEQIKIISMFLVIVVFLGLWLTLFSYELRAEDKIVRIGYVNWPGVTLKSHVVKEILETLGYKVDLQMLMLPVIYKGLDNDDLDIFLGMWYPTMRPNFTPYQEKGTIEKVRVNLNETIYKIAVPEYVWNKGVKSLADLNNHADKFDYKIIGIEPGNEGNQIMIDAIADNTYNLKEWELIEGSTAAMMAALGKATKNNEWIAFLGWEPHWMNLEYDIKYLDDPEKIWGEGEVVYTIARDGYKEDMPEVYKFLMQFKVTPKMQNDWIYEYGKKKRDPDEVAIEWIQNNLNVVDQFVYGVNSLDDQRARDVIRKRFN